MSIGSVYSQAYSATNKLFTEGKVNMFLLATARLSSFLRRISSLLSRWAIVALTGAFLFQSPIRASATGGMWTPSQVEELEDLLAELGISVDPRELSDPSSRLLKSIISLGFCSGSFVSRSGLIFTNHHCAQAMLAYLSSQDAGNGAKVDYFTDGFQAKSLAEERSVGPAQSVFVTQKITDVTDQILSGLEKIADPAARTRELDRRRLAIVAQVEKGRPDIRAELTSFYNGAQFQLIEKLRIQDVRLVFAPPAGIGFFGGDDMNFAYPRFTGDFSVLRAYVGRDGRSAPYAPDNIPYEPEEHLRISAKGVGEGDGVFVAGFPGRTYRLLPYATSKSLIEHQQPWQVVALQEVIHKLDELGVSSEEIRMKSSATRQRLMNASQALSMTLEALENSGFMAQRQKREADLERWIKVDLRSRSRYGDVLARIEQLTRDADEKFESDALLDLVERLPNLISSALRIAKFAEERERTDSEREPGYQDRDVEQAIKEERALAMTYHRQIATELIVLVIEKALAGKGPVSQTSMAPGWLSAFVDMEALKKGKSVRDQVTELFNATTFEDVELRTKLLQTATISTLAESEDPIVRAAVHLRRHLRQKEERDRARRGQEILILPRYTQAWQEFGGRRMAPDANGTLRLTFGRVMRSSPEVSDAPATTNLTDMLTLADEKGRAFPYAAPELLFNAAQRDPAWGQQTVNFLSDVDITGGNSGSAVMNAHGALVGLMFDGLKTSLQSSYTFGPTVRNIAVDATYVLKLLRLYEADHVLKDLTIVGEPEETSHCQGDLID